MDWRAMNSSKSETGIRFYMTALQYGQVLWLKNLPARALLTVDRALLADLSGDEAELKDWPLPYRAMAWIIANYREEDFAGNPRVHFQHLASRVRGDRKEQRMWRAWACWYLTRRVRPLLPGDSIQDIKEPTLAEISNGLRSHGIPNELATWQSVINELSG
jgi:hypothetical protein